MRLECARAVLLGKLTLQKEWTRQASLYNAGSADDGIKISIGGIIMRWSLRLFLRCV